MTFGIITHDMESSTCVIKQFFHSFGLRIMQIMSWAKRIALMGIALRLMPVAKNLTAHMCGIPHLSRIVR